MPLAGEIKPASSRILEKAPRSSARSIASGVVPRIGIPYAAKPCAKPRAVCPPNWTTTPTRFPLADSA